MKVKETITSFWRRVDFQFWKASRRPAFWGRLDRHLVQSEKPVIVFESPRILMVADSVEEATDFLLKEAETRQVPFASVYKHDTREWHKVAVRPIKPSPPPEAATAPAQPS